MNPTRPILKDCLFRTRPLENVATPNIFLCDLWFATTFFFFFGYRKFRYCSRIYVRNWFTLLNEQNLLLDLWMNTVYFEKKSPYLPTHRWNGGSGAGNKYIFKGGPKHRDEFRCSERVSSSCSTSDTHRVTLVTNPKYHMKPEISSEWGKDREFEVFMTSWTYPWSFVTQLMVFRDS